MGTNTTVELINMFSLSETRPELGDHLISREQYLSFLENQLEDHTVLCVDGEEGVGVTTTLALFAKNIVIIVHLISTMVGLVTC